jgi:hypothetical protein
MTDVWEFYAPFAHVEGKYEWCRIRTTTHGAFDTFILFPYSERVTVYVIDDAGQRFMQDRYPECDTYRALSLSINEQAAGQQVAGSLAADVGPIREITMQFAAQSVLPKAVEYGGKGQPVWNSKRFTCWGVDYVLDARASGQIRWHDDRLEQLEDVAAIVTSGSVGHIMPIGTHSTGL